MPRAVSLRERLESGGVSIGPFAKLTDPAVVEILAIAGFDHIIIDREHGPVSLERAQDLIRAAELRGMAPVVRVPRNEESEILRALDLGAEAVHIPQIGDAEAARRAVEACRFHPEGGRGVCRFVRAADYSAKPRSEHFAESNRRALPILHIEGVEGIANLPAILDAMGSGVVFLGPYDLSQSCGVPGETNHPTVVARMREAASLARERGAVLGTFVEDAAGARRWADAGVRYLCYSVDVGILMDAARRAASDLRAALASE